MAMIALLNDINVLGVGTDNSGAAAIEWTTDNKEALFRLVVGGGVRATQPLGTVADNMRIGRRRRCADRFSYISFRLRVYRIGV